MQFDTLYGHVSVMKKSKSASVILVGMPGSGKSTLGVMLAKALGIGFIDTDILIQLREGKALYEILDSQGYITLRNIEEAVLLDNLFNNMVVATGGSAVYSEKAMTHLKQFGQIAYLKVATETLKSRTGDLFARGVAAKSTMTLEDIAAEREPLYERYADLTVEVGDLNSAQVLKVVCDCLHSDT